MNQYQHIDLADAFKRYFTLVPALSEALRDETFHVRHEVYCRDLGWEPVRADGRETDEYDARSVACLMRSVTTGAPVGCVRLILCDPAAPQTPLPIEQACAGTLDRRLFDPAKYDRSRLAEVSRLAVTRDYRRRKGEAQKPLALDHTDFGDDGHARFPYIPVGLFMAVFALADQLGLDRLLVLTEPRLVVHLGRIGFHIQQIGDAVEHHGERIPALIDRNGVLNRMHPVVQAIWDHVHTLVAEAFARAAPEQLPRR